MNIYPNTYDSRLWMSTSLKGCNGYDKGFIEYGVVDDDGGTMIAFCRTKKDADLIAAKLNGKEELKTNKHPRIFRVTNREKEGTCYSWYDHFDVVFDDEEYITTHELSFHNIRKTDEAMKQEASLEN